MRSPAPILPGMTIPDRLPDAPRSPIRRNVVANLSGRAWTALLYLALAPVYVDLMGVEAYGLVGLFLSLFAVSSILELGLSSALNRELASRTARREDPSGARDLLRTLEPVYWGLALLIGGLTLAAAPMVAQEWLNDAELPVGTVENAVMLMALVLVVQWPLNLYAGGLLGLERHVALNVILGLMMTVRMGGAALVLWLVDPSVTAFFTWQAITAGIHTLVARAWLWRSLPRPSRPARFRRQLFASVWRFSLGVGATSVLVVLLTQLDKLLLSGLLSLEDFGYYSLAALLSSGISYVSLPVFQSVFPRLTGLVAVADESSLTRLYHSASQLMAVLVLPVAAVIVLFSSQVVELWTGSSTTASNVHDVAALLVAGTALNALASVPYALQLAHGWTRLSFSLNLVAVVLFVPLLVVATNRYGAVGAAGLWLALNVGYVGVGMQLMHRRLLPSEKRSWYARDVALPAAATLAVAGLFRAAYPAPSSEPLIALWLLTAFLASATACIAAAPAAKVWVREGLALLGRRRAGRLLCPTKRPRHQ